MPAAAVTPAPEAYIKVVAVKKLVVGSGSHSYILSLVLLAWFCRVGFASRFSGCASFLLCLFTGVDVTGGHVLLVCWHAS